MVSGDTIRYAFVTVTDRDYFPGTLATVNSIRHFHPDADVFVVHNEKNALTLRQHLVLAKDARVRVIGSSAFARNGRFINAWELKAYVACDLSGDYEVIVGIDSDCLLCSRVYDQVEQCRAIGGFIGGRDVDQFYDESYRVYGFPTPAHNVPYMSTSIYFAASNERNVRVLNRWSECSSAACYNGTGPYPGHGDQGVLNAILFAEGLGQSIGLLENELWSQHWVYWSSVIEFRDGAFINHSFGDRRQRSFHCADAAKFWDRAHRDDVRNHPGARDAYAWFLAMLWCGNDDVSESEVASCLPGHTKHLQEDLISFGDHVRIVQAN